VQIFARDHRWRNLRRFRQRRLIDPDLLGVFRDGVICGR
jgi:hypothetical protein